jgi:hypothetical protein
MPKKLTHSEFLQILWNKNEHYRNGEFEVISEYKPQNKDIHLRNKYGVCKLKPPTLFKNNNISKRSAIDKTSYGVENFKQIYEKLKRIEEDRITEKV